VPGAGEAFQFKEADPLSQAGLAASRCGVVSGDHGAARSGACGRPSGGLTESVRTSSSNWRRLSIVSDAGSDPSGRASSLGVAIWWLAFSRPLNARPSLRVRLGT